MARKNSLGDNVQKTTVSETVIDILLTLNDGNRYTTGELVKSIRKNETGISKTAKKLESLNFITVLPQNKYSINDLGRRLIYLIKPIGWFAGINALYNTKDGDLKISCKLLDLLLELKNGERTVDELIRKTGIKEPKIRSLMRECLEPTECVDSREEPTSRAMVFFLLIKGKHIVEYYLEGISQRKKSNETTINSDIKFTRFKKTKITEGKVKVLEALRDKKRYVIDDVVEKSGLTRNVVMGIIPELTPLL